MSTPLTWDEIESCKHAEDLVFTAPDVLDRIDDDGDLFEPLLAAVSKRPKVPAGK